MPTVSSRARQRPRAPSGLSIGLLLAAFVACSAEDTAEGDVVQCDNQCPDGTARSTYDKVVSGDADLVISDECEAACEPILPCTYPNIPLITADGSGKTTYKCEPLEGYTDIAKDDEVDFSWAEAAHCVDGQMNDDETGVDCGGATCTPC